MEGDNASVTVWYTTNAVTATREIDGVNRTMEDWINNDAEAQAVAAWGREAWQRYYEVFGRHPYNCGMNVNLWLGPRLGSVGCGILGVGRLPHRDRYAACPGQRSCVHRVPSNSLPRTHALC